MSYSFRKFMVFQYKKWRREDLLTSFSNLHNPLLWSFFEAFQIFLQIVFSFPNVYQETRFYSKNMLNLTFSNVKSQTFQGEYPGPPPVLQEREKKKEMEGCLVLILNNYKLLKIRCIKIFKKSNHPHRPILEPPLLMLGLNFSTIWTPFTQFLDPPLLVKLWICILVVWFDWHWILSKC